MFRIRFTLDVGRKDEPGELEPTPGESGPGSAQVEDAGYGSADARPMQTGFGLPYLEDPGPEGPY